MTEIDLTGSLPCLCPDDTCADLGCVAPNPNWWLAAPSTCTLQIDPEAVCVKNGGTVFAQARECQNSFASTVIDNDDPWVIDIHITLNGDPPFCTCGLWCVSACLEDMCGPTYFRFPKDSDPDNSCCCLVATNQFTSDYEISICIPGGIVTESVCGAPYELTVIVTLLSRDPIPTSPPGDPCDPTSYMPLGVACAVELPLMTFYKGQ